MDPLGTGLSKPYIDKKDFFQHLKNPPKKVLKDLVTTNSGDTFPTNFDLTLDPLDPIIVRDEVGQKSGKTFEDGDFANFETFDTESERLSEAVVSSPQAQQNVAAENFDSRQPSMNRSNQRSINHQPLSVSLPPEESPVHHKSCSMSSATTSAITRMDKDSGDSMQTLMRLPSPKKYQSMKKRDHEMELASTGWRRESIDKPFPVDFSKSMESCSSEANSRLSSSSAEMDIVPEPPPRGTASILINPPPLPPKKQAVRGGSVKPPPRPPYTDSQLHYDFIEREETSPSPTRREHTQSPAQIDSTKSRFDDNFSPSTSRMNEIKRTDDNSSASRYDSMIPTTLSTLFRNPYISSVSNETKRVLGTATTSSSFATTVAAKPSLDITLSQLTSSNLAEFATSLDMSVTELTSLTLQQLTECLARLSAKEVNGHHAPQRQGSSPATNSAKLVETSFVSSEPLFKADFEANDVKNAQQKQDVQEHPVYDKYAVFRELVEMEQMKEDSAASEIADATTSADSSEEHGDRKSVFSSNDTRDRTSGGSDLLASCNATVELPPLDQTMPDRVSKSNEKSEDRKEAIKDEVIREDNKIAGRLQSSTSRGDDNRSAERLETERMKSQRIDEKRKSKMTREDSVALDEQEVAAPRAVAEDDEEEEAEEEDEEEVDEEINSIAIDRSSSEEKPAGSSVALTTERQASKNLAEDDLMKLFTEPSSETATPKRPTSGQERDIKGTTNDIFEEIKMLNRTQDSKVAGRSPRKPQSGVLADEEKTTSSEKPGADRVTFQTKVQRSKARIRIDDGRKEELPAAGECDDEEEEADEDEEIDKLSNVRERSSSEEKTSGQPVASPIEQRAAKSLAEHDLLKLFSETTSDTVSPRKAPAASREEDVRAATDIFEEIRMLNSSGGQSVQSGRRSKDSLKATTTTSGFEDVFCPFVESKHDLKDGQESLTGSIKDEGNWAKFENVGVFNSDKSSYDDPASVGGTSPWSPDEKDFQVEGGGRKAAIKQQPHRLQSGESDNEWKDDEESEESNGRRQFRDEGGFWYSRHQRMEPGEDSPYYDESVGRMDKDWHFCERERGGRKFRGGMWSKQPSAHRSMRDPSPWHEDPAGGRWPRDDDEHAIQRGRYSMSRKQLSASYKDDPDDSSKTYWKCRAKQRPWNGDREGFRNPAQQQVVQPSGHFVGEPVFYEEDRAKKRMMLWSGERDDECERDRFSSQESMGYEDEERWSRREYERRRGEKWDDEALGPGGRFWPRRPPGEAVDLRSEYGGDRPVAAPQSQTAHEIYRKQHYCRESRDPRERAGGHDVYSSGVTGSAGGWLEDEYSLPDRSDNSPRYLTRKRHWPKRPNSANDERNMGEPVYSDPRVKYGMSRSECSDNDSELYHRPYRSRSRESYWGSDQDFESWTGLGSGSERLYWSEGPDAKSETLHRRRINRHKSNRAASQKSQSSPFEDDFAETIDRAETSFDSFVLDAKQTTTPRNVKEHLRKADPRSSRYPKQASTGANRSSGYFDSETAPGESSPGERPRQHSDSKTGSDSFPAELGGKVQPASGEAFVAEEVSTRDSFFNGEPSPGFDDDAFAFKSEMADSVPETTSATNVSLKNSRQIKYGNNKVKPDHDIKKSESVNIFVRESDPFDDDDFFK